MSEVARASPTRVALTIHADEILAAAFSLLLAIFALASSRGGFETLDRTRLTFFTVIGLLLFAFATLVARGEAESSRRFSAIGRAWWSVALGILAYETMKHLHANEITIALGIRPMDGVMLAIDERLFGAALPLRLEGMVRPWLTWVLEQAYVHFYYATPIGLLGYFFFFRDDLRAFCDLRRAILFTLFGGYVSYILIPVAGPMFVIGDRFTVPLGMNRGIERIAWDSLRYNWDCFPSLHTAVPWVATLVAWRKVNRLARVALASAASLVTFSTVYLRFHYGIDVIAGLIWAALVAAWATREWKPVRLRFVLSAPGRDALHTLALSSLAAAVVAAGVGIERLLEQLLAGSLAVRGAGTMVLVAYVLGLLGGIIVTYRIAGSRMLWFRFALTEASIAALALLTYLGFDSVARAGGLAGCLAAVLAFGAAKGCAVGLFARAARPLLGVPRVRFALSASALLALLVTRVVTAQEIVPRFGLWGSLLLAGALEVAIFLTATAFAPAPESGESHGSRR